MCVASTRQSRSGSLLSDLLRLRRFNTSAPQRRTSQPAEPAGSLSTTAYDRVQSGACAQRAGGGAGARAS
ncbi:hypothetical protein M3J09_012291 [Ascochyta lentis]